MLDTGGPTTCDWSTFAEQILELITAFRPW